MGNGNELKTNDEQPSSSVNADGFKRIYSEISYILVEEGPNSGIFDNVMILMINLLLGILD